MNSFRSDKRIEAFVLLLSLIVSIILGIVFMSFISFPTKNIDIFVIAFLFLFSLIFWFVIIWSILLGLKKRE